MSNLGVHPIAEGGFQTSDLYDRVRPGYSKEAVEFLLGNLGVTNQNVTHSEQKKVLELGAGTGKLTVTMKEVLRGQNVQIISSDPVLSMREKFRQVLPDVEIKEFSAENIDLPDSSVHAVVAAQCFHWFANHESLFQIHRVLVPEGRLGLIWNQPDHVVPWAKEINEQIIYPSYEQAKTPYQQSGEWQKVMEESTKFKLLGANTAFAYEQTFTLGEFLDRLMSISVIAVKSEADKMMIKDQVKNILSEHKVIQIPSDSIVLPYQVKMFWYERR